MSAPNFNRIEDYTLTLATGEVDRTTYWKDENRREPANVWWIEGPGISRPANDIEINLWKQSMVYHCQQTNAAVRADLEECLVILNRPKPAKAKRK